MSAPFKSQDRTNVEKARAAWGDNCPSWVIVMAQACDDSTQAKVGRCLNYTSGSVVSAVIGKIYKGDMGLVEKRVMGELMAATIECPATGEIALAVCLETQDHAKRGNRTSAFRARMVKACTECPRSRIGG